MLAEDQRLAQVVGKLRALTTLSKEALKESRAVGFESDDIARVCGVPEDVVKTLLDNWGIE